MDIKQVTVVVCGDEGVGKSSLITALVKETFVPNIQKTIPVITIPPDISTPESVTTQIIDTSSAPNDRDALCRDIRRANVICLVYSDDYSCERVALFWLPLFRSLGVNLPVVLCANKSDLNEEPEANQALEDEMIPIMQEFKEVESCIRCSAKSLVNVNEVFYLCQRSVTHPISPLFDFKEQQLKTAAVAALQRVFFLSDTDQDGRLNDDEMNELQRKCFDKSLPPAELQDIKDTIAKASTDAIKDGGITEYGFILLNKIFAEKGRHETTWTILRKFEYTDSLSLKDKFLHPKLDVPAFASVELSPAGYRFFVDLFARFDKDNDGALNPAELAFLFAHTPSIPPSWRSFPYTTVRNEAGNVTLQGWLAQWSATTLMDHTETLRYLAYLGFEGGRGGTTDALKVTKPRKHGGRVNKKADRNVFCVYVVGEPGAGKSAILNAFLNKPLGNDYVVSSTNITTSSTEVCNAVEIQGKQRYMILKELLPADIDLLDSDKHINACDVLCLAYDSSNSESFMYLASLREKYPKISTLPCVYAATKSDLDRVAQHYEVQPDVYCRELGVAAPIHVSVHWGSVSDLFVQLAEAAQSPQLHRPKAEEKSSPNLRLVIGLTAFTALAVSVGTGIWYRYYRHTQTQK
ncbi:mitochondrial Rho GTPase-like protein [Saitoella complicata NRRL Y-17804]|nr:mitochondrial Rho GTPase-like protein [Saitoella complicata NRRL Y-17804]ODQ53896.1 mitochondrial Rho GTPase-like protein [Saitoella complicata NRRL Y-17804]